MSRKTWMALGAAAIVIVLGIAIYAGIGKNNGSKESSETESTAKGEEAVEGIQLPYNTGTEDDNIEISSLYQFSGPNPDCQGEDGEDIASLTVTNTTNRLLKSADIKVIMKDKTEYQFHVEYLPAGKKAELFDTNNAQYKVNDEDGRKIAIKNFEIEEEFSDNADLMEDQITVEVEDYSTEVKLTNQSDKDIEGLVMRCHTLFDEEYFGGLTYTYEVGDIAAGESVTYDAIDCMIGGAEVVELTTR